MDYNGRDEKETQETQEEFPLYTERIIINPMARFIAGLCIDNNKG